MKKLKRVLVCMGVTVMVLASVAARAQTINALDPAIRERVDRIARQVLEQTGVPSASVAVVKGGKLVYTHAYGKARLASGDTPSADATPEMRYSIGSISKQFTATAILLLQEQGKLSLDDAVGKYVPGLTRGDEVTIRQILSHTSGYQDYWPEDYVMTTMLHPETAQQIIDTWGKKPLDFEPGTEWQYSNTNFVIAGAIVEKVTGRPYMEFLTQHIFRPLGMQSVWNSDEAKLTQVDATAVLSPRTRATSCGAEGGARLDVRGRRAGHDAARSGAVGRELDCANGTQARELQADVH
jgi:D-alanyl-D-alanine carboxypeptidase